MLLLLNTRVVKAQLTLELPAGLEGLADAAPAAVLQAGCELYARHPRLEVDQPDMARWYGTLLLQKLPNAGGALFHAVDGKYAVRMAEIELVELARLWSLQEHGTDIAREVWSTIWGPVTAA